MLRISLEMQELLETKLAQPADFYLGKFREIVRRLK